MPRLRTRGAVEESTDRILRESLEKLLEKGPITTCRSKPGVRSFVLNGGNLARRSE
jgi:hypothetical protein